MDYRLNTLTEKSFCYTSPDKIFDHYHAFLIDLWGVVHDGFQAYPGVVDSLNYLISQNKPIIFLSNAPRPDKVVMKKLIELGIHVTPDMILTSGDAVRHQLQHYEDPVFKQLGKCFYHLGAIRNQDILADIEANVTDNLDEANFILLSVFLDEGEDLQQFQPFLQEAHARKIPIVCANPDKVVIHGNSQRYCAGVFAAEYEKMGGTVHYYGKPHPAILEFALKKLKHKGVQDKSKIIMIGDTLETDIQSAKIMGVDSALVLTGNMEIILAKNNIKNHVQNPNDISLINCLNNHFKKSDLTPTWIIPSLAL
jgi:HAD superfamily hydrolase (TIGR01459 family)